MQYEHTSEQRSFACPRSVFRVLSVTKEDFVWQTFRAGGKGGQKQNKTSSGVRCIHPPSGAVGEGRDERSQPQNRKNAWLRCIQSDKFQLWLHRQTNRLAFDLDQIEREIAAEVDRQMDPSNILVEVWDGEQWTQAN